VAARVVVANTIMGFRGEVCFEFSQPILEGIESSGDIWAWRASVTIAMDCSHEHVRNVRWLHVGSTTDTSSLFVMTKMICPGPYRVGGVFDVQKGA